LVAVHGYKFWSNEGRRMTLSVGAESIAELTVPLRAPNAVMRLDRMGSAFATRLSFMRVLVRRMAHENWQFKTTRFDMDDDGFGVAVLSVQTPDHTYSLVVFTHDLDPEMRTDRVIAEAWDATFVLFDGVPNNDDIDRLRRNAPYQEAGRFAASELVLGRANKSIRLFGHAVEKLSLGQQPDLDQVTSVGYLMRTTAVYGSGKFGCADRAKTENRPGVQAPFQVELLAVYMFRWFVLMWVDSLAERRGGDGAVQLNDVMRQHIGIGNATGLGMAPFLLNHPVLLHTWVAARETALARVRSLQTAIEGSAKSFQQALSAANQHIAEWQVDDAVQSARIKALRCDIMQVVTVADDVFLTQRYPWDSLYQYAETAFSLEGQELLIALMLEVHGPLIDDLSGNLHADETVAFDPAMTTGQLLILITQHYDWALETDFSAPQNHAKFWYYSEEKLEPRLGNRLSEPGGDLEMPLAFGRDVAALYENLRQANSNEILAIFLMAHPDHRYAAKRVQITGVHPYAEIRDNLIAETVRPIDLLRFKLAFFGATHFDPKSDLWTRITLFSGAPLPEDLGDVDPDGWAFPVQPQAA